MLEVTPAALRDAAIEVSNAGRELAYDSPHVLNAKQFDGVEGRLSGGGFYASRRADELLELAGIRLKKAADNMHAVSESLATGLDLAADAYDAGEAEGALAFAYGESGAKPPRGVDEDDFERASELYGAGEESSGLPTSLHNGTYVDGYQHRPEHAYRPSSYTDTQDWTGSYVDATKRYNDPWFGVDHYEPPLPPGADLTNPNIDPDRDIEEDRDYGS